MNTKTASVILSQLLILLLLSSIPNRLEAENSSEETFKPQNDIGVIFGFGIQSNGDLQNKLKDFYIDQGWSDCDNTPSCWLELDCGLQFRAINKLYITPGYKLLYSTVEKTTVWEDFGYSQNEADINLMLMPTMAMKYIIYNQNMHSITINGILSKPSWNSGPEGGFKVKSDGLETGLFLGYELGNPISSKKNTGYAQAIDRTSIHFVIESGFSSIPVKINSTKCNVGGFFVNLKTYFGFKDWS